MYSVLLTQRAIQIVMYVCTMYVCMYTISEKAIRFRHLDYNPDQAQKLISLSMSQHLLTRNSSSKYMHLSLSNVANRQTDRQTRAKTFTSSFVGGNNMWLDVNGNGAVFVCVNWSVDYVFWCRVNSAQSKLSSDKVHMIIIISLLLVLLFFFFHLILLLLLPLPRWR